MPDKEPDEPKPCCNRKPLMFYDTKVGHSNRMIVLACPWCGKYLDGTKPEDLTTRWNSDLAKSYEDHIHPNRHKRHHRHLHPKQGRDAHNYPPGIDPEAPNSSPEASG